MRDDPVPTEHQLALDMWKCYHIAIWGLMDNYPMTWWTLQPIEREWWIGAAQRLADAYEVRRRPT